MISASPRVSFTAVGPKGTTMKENTKHLGSDHKPTASLAGMGDVLREEIERREFTACLRQFQQVWEAAEPGGKLAAEELLAQLRASEQAKAEIEDAEQLRRICEPFRELLRAGLEFKVLRDVSVDGLRLLARREQGDITAGQDFADVWARFGIEARDMLEAANTPGQEGSNATQPSGERGGEDVQNLFREAGDVWSIRYGGGEIFSVKDSLGMKYIARLMERPNKDVGVQELVTVVRKTTGEMAARTPEMLGIEPADPTDQDFPGDAQIGEQAAGEVIDKETMESTKKRLADIGTELEQAKKNHDEAAIDRLAKEREDILDYFRQADGLANRPRQFTDEIEKMRGSVSKAIDRAIRAICAYNESLAAHLELSIQTGRSCSYRPERKIDWHT